MLRTSDGDLRPWVERCWRGRNEADEMMIGCLALAQLLLQVHENAEDDSRAQRGEKSYGEPHKGEQCVFHRSFLSQAEWAFKRQYDYRNLGVLVKRESR